MTTTEDRPGWWRFFAWTVIGTAIVVSVLGAMTIGIFVLPFAILGVILMAKRNEGVKADKRSALLMFIVGLPSLLIAYGIQNRSRLSCTPYTYGIRRCTPGSGLWPFLIAGAMLGIAVVTLFIRTRTKRRTT